MKNTKDAYRQKAEAELDLAHARLDEFKARVKNFKAETRLSYTKHLEELEHGVDTAKSRLKELSEAGEDGWEKMKDGVERALTGLRKAIHDATEKFRD